MTVNTSADAPGLGSRRPTTERVPPARVQSFAIVTAGFGQNFVLTTVTTFVLLYLTTYAKISVAGIAVVTVVIAVAKVLDAITDPIVGNIIDRTSTRWGKLRPFVLFSAAPVAILTGLLFTVPSTTEPLKLLFFSVCYLIWGIAYSFCDVPLWGLIGSAFGDSLARTKVVSKVRAFGSISLGLATLGLPLLATAFSFALKATSSGWSIAVFVTCIVGMGLYTLAFFFTREKHIDPDKVKLSFRELFGTLVKNTPLLMVLLGSILGFGRLIVQAGGAVFAVIAYDDPSYFTFIGAALILGIVISSFLTPQLLRFTTSRILAIGCSLAGAVLYLVMFFSGFSNLVALLIFIFLSGLTLGVFLVVQATLIADAVDDVEKRTGVRNDGISFATLTFVSKLMNAAAVLVFGLFLVIANYHEGVHITPGLQNTVWFSLTIVPAISCVLSAIPFVFYRLGGPKNPKADAAVSVPA